MDKAIIPTRISDEQIQKWKESTARRREELFGRGSRRMIPMGRNRKIGKYEEHLEVEDVFGSTDLK